MSNKHSSHFLTFELASNWQASKLVITTSKHFPYNYAMAIINDVLNSLNHQLLTPIKTMIWECVCGERIITWSYMNWRLDLVINSWSGINGVRTAWFACVYWNFSVPKYIFFFFHSILHHIQCLINNISTRWSCFLFDKFIDEFALSEIFSSSRFIKLNLSIII